MNDEEIRKRRLARLGQLGQSSEDSRPQLSTTNQKPTPPPPSSSQLPKASLLSRPPQSDEVPGKTSPQQPTPVTAAPKDIAKKSQEGTRASIDVIAEALQITIVPPSESINATNPGSRRTRAAEKTYLPALAESISESKGTVRALTIDDVDEALWELLTTAAAERPYENALFYCRDCWQRCVDLERRYANNREAIEQLEHTRRSLVSSSYLCIIADPSDEIYGDVSSFLLSFSNTLPVYFIEAILVYAKEQQETDSLSMIILEGIRPKGFDSGYRSNFAVTEQLLSLDFVAKGLLTLEPSEKLLERNTAEITPRYLAERTFLGPYFSVSPLDGNAPLELFRNYTSSPSELLRIAENTHLEVNLIEKTLFNITNRIVRSGPQHKRAILDFFGRVLDINHKQVAMQVDRRQVNGSGFMCNILHTLLKFTEPFTDLSGAQLSKINPEYFRHTCSFAIDEETKLLADQSAPYNLTDRLESAPNFVTESFFLAVGFLHFGFQGTLQAEEHQRRLRRHIQDQMDSARRILAASPAMANGPMAHVLQRGEASAQSVAAAHTSFVCILRNEEFMRAVLHFSTFALVYAMYASQNPDISDAYASFPEFLVEAPLNAIVHVLRQLPELARRSANGRILVQVVVYFMQNPKVLRNPYLRSRMVEILWLGGIDQPLTNGTSVPGFLASVFTDEPLCHDQLVHSLMRIYIDIEHTGRSSEFYDKFNVREMVSHVLKVLWRHQIYRAKLVDESTRDPDFFVKFVALLLNDSTYLLDEALGKLNEIHKLQVEAQNGASAQGPSGGPQDQQSAPGNEASISGSTADAGSTNTEGDADMDDEEGSGNSLASRLESAEKQAKTMLQLGNTCVDLLYTFTKSIPAIFTTAEIVDRFAVMLNYNLAALVGPRCNQLKVKDPAKVSFNPKQLLCDLIRVFLNLAGQEPFVRALARDERSYSPENYDKALSILDKFGLLAPNEYGVWKSLTSRVAEVHEQENEDEEELGDIPDDYLDPLMYTLMENPVKLPSNVSIDLNTIKTHLLSDPTDPFTRQPMTIEDVVPDVELKSAIEAFKAERKRNK